MWVRSRVRSTDTPRQCSVGCANICISVELDRIQANAFVSAALNGWGNALAPMEKFWTHFHALSECSVNAASSLTKCSRGFWFAQRRNERVDDSFIDVVDDVLTIHDTWPRDRPIPGTVRLDSGSIILPTYLPTTCSSIYRDRLWFAASVGLDVWTTIPMLSPE
jgi:hypothetical protein